MRPQDPYQGAMGLPLPGGVADSLILEVKGMIAHVFTGIYSEETGRAQPLRISVRAALKPQAQYASDSPLATSFDYMQIKNAATIEIETAGHFQLIEAVADHICHSIFSRCGAITAVTVSIVKLALSAGSEEIGISMQRQRRRDLHLLLDTDRYPDVEGYQEKDEVDGQSHGQTCRRCTGV